MTLDKVLRTEISRALFVGLNSVMCWELCKQALAVSFTLFVLFVTSLCRYSEVCFCLSD